MSPCGVLHTKSDPVNSEMLLVADTLLIIPEQFTVKVHPALFEGEGEGPKKLRNTFQRLRPEEFSSGDFGLRSFRQPEISA